MENANIERDRNAINTSKRLKWKASRLTKKQLYARENKPINYLTE